MSNEQLVRRYVEAILGHDHDALDRLRHSRWSAVWPQSGELVTNARDWRQIVDNYPGGRPELVSERLIGSEDRWVVSPLGGAYRVGGEGDNWWSEWRITYPDGRLYWSIVLLELRDGKVYCETSYWAEPFDPPPWRAQWVQRQQGERPPGRGGDDPGPGPIG
jgi:hypothetical protein